MCRSWARAPIICLLPGGFLYQEAPCCCQEGSRDLMPLELTRPLGELTANPQVGECGGGDKHHRTCRGNSPSKEAKNVRGGNSLILGPLTEKHEDPPTASHPRKASHSCLQTSAALGSHLSQVRSPRAPSDLEGTPAHSEPCPCLAEVSPATAQAQSHFAAGPCHLSGTGWAWGLQTRTRSGSVHSIRVQCTGPKQVPGGLSRNSGVRTYRVCVPPCPHQQRGW